MLEEEKALEEIKELTEENNEMLRSMQNRAKIAVVFKILYWIVILGFGVGAFYYLQPYLEKAQSAYNSVLDAQKKVGEIPKNFADMFNFGKD